MSWIPPVKCVRSLLWAQGDQGVALSGRPAHALTHPCSARTSAWSSAWALDRWPDVNTVGRGDRHRGSNECAWTGVSLYGGDGAATETELGLVG